MCQFFEPVTFFRLIKTSLADRQLWEPKVLEIRKVGNFGQM